VIYVSGRILEPTFLLKRPKTNSIVRFNITASFVLRPACLLDPRIVGGSVTDIRQHPYQLSLHEYLWHICGAVIISNKWILTAAHCVRYVLFHTYVERVQDQPYHPLIADFQSNLKTTIFKISKLYNHFLI